jgi:cation diffusion facilitator CzcD-associated flavoprotein CzcO
MLAPIGHAMSEPSTVRVAIKTDIVVIGAGQAGLSSAYHLKRRGLVPGQSFIVLDGSPQPGGAWQYRSPSLTLSTVNRIHDLPGMRFSPNYQRTEAPMLMLALIAQNLR